LEDEMVLTMVGIIVYRGKAYISSFAETEAGFHVRIEPVYVVNINGEELLCALRKALAVGNPRIPTPTREELSRKGPVLRATKARSMKELAKTGAAYNIAWTDKGIEVETTRLDKQGRWEFDPGKRRVFPSDTPLEEIVAVILEDIRSRPEVWQ